MNPHASEAAPGLRLVIAGGSGALGHALSEFWARTHGDVVVLSRTPRLNRRVDGREIAFVPWNGDEVGPWHKYLEGARALVNFAGRSVNCRYTPRNKADILHSRLRPTRALAQAISQCESPPPVWLNAASATIYRDSRERDMDEVTGQFGEGFSIDVCLQWERAFIEASVGPHEDRVRRVALRMAMVMGPGKGEVFEVFSNLVRHGLGGVHGDGGQWMSWIHHADLCRAIDFLIGRGDLEGAVNICAPRPLPEHEFLSVLRHEWHMPLGLPTPRPALELGARLIGTEPELLLKSRRVVPRRLLEAGFEFGFATWEEAARDLVRSACHPHKSASTTQSN
jgi:uncharacterized protein (TIGR01777 family)